MTPLGWTKMVRQHNLRQSITDMRKRLEKWKRRIETPRPEIGLPEGQFLELRVDLYNALTAITNLETKLTEETDADQTGK